MEHKKIAELLEKYYQGESTLEEELLLEEYLVNNSDRELEGDRAQFFYFKNKKAETKEGYMPINIEELIGARNIKQSDTFTPGQWTVGIAASFIFLLIGFLGGMVLQNERYRDASREITSLQQSLVNLQQMFLTAQLKQPSPTERILGISMASSFRHLNPGIKSLLIEVLNEDSNSNVRINAANALAEFTDDSEVLEALVSLLPEQDNLAIQVAIVNALLKSRTEPALNAIREAIRKSYLPEGYAKQLMVELEKIKVKI